MRAPLAMLVVGAAACGSHEAGTATEAVAPGSLRDDGEAFQGSFSPPPRVGAAVVATVNGERIYAADVARQMAARGESGPKALAELVDAELLAQAARAQGLADAPEVVWARKRERVRLLLQREFEPRHADPAAIPQADVDLIFDDPRSRGRFDHPEYRIAAHVMAAHDPTGKVTEDQTRGVAFAFYQAALLAHPATREDFLALAAQVSKDTGVAILPADKDMYTTEHEGPAVPEFAAAAFALARVGAISPPVRTQYGWHVLWLTQIIPPVHLQRAQADAVLRKELFDAWRRGTFLRWVRELGAAHRVERAAGADALLRDLPDEGM